MRKKNNEIRPAFTQGVGTNKYMAPECASGTKYSVSADVYSLAVTTWEVHLFLLFLHEYLRLTSRYDYIREKQFGNSGILSVGVVCHTTQNYFVDVVVDVAVKAQTTSEKSQHFEVEEKLPKRYFWRNNSGEERGEDGG